MLRLATGLALSAFLTTGCSSPPTGFDSPVPSERLNAITKAADTRDTTAIPHLIAFLESDDPVVRMASIRTLELLTGTTLGYDYAAPEWERNDHVQQWVTWYKRQNPGQTPPATGPALDTRPEKPIREGSQA